VQSKWVAANGKSIAEVQEIEFRHTRQLKPNLYLKVEDLPLAEFIMPSWIGR